MRLSEMPKQPATLAIVFAIALAAVGCSDSPEVVDFSCRWREPTPRSTDTLSADAQVVDGRLVALRLESRTGVIPDGAPGVCRYDLHGKRFEHDIASDGGLRLRFLNEQGEGIGYLDYRIEDNRLTIENIERSDCAVGRILLPIEMSLSPGRCRVGLSEAR